MDKHYIYEWIDIHFGITITKETDRRKQMDVLHHQWKECMAKLRILAEEYEKRHPPSSLLTSLLKDEL